MKNKMSENITYNAKTESSDESDEENQIESRIVQER
jgi:hypothetical protein